MILYLSAAFAQSTPPPDPAPDPAPAGVSEDAETQARLLYGNGAQLYQEGQYAAAIVAFREAYSLSRNPKLLLNVSNAQERLGDPAAALATLTEYRVYAAPDEAQTLDRRIRALEERIDELRREEEARRAAQVSAAPAPAPLGPVASTTTTVGNPARWAVVVGGAATAVGFGAVAAYTYVEGQARVDAADREGYEALRPLNTVAFTLSLVGLGVGAAGLALPATRTVPVTTTLSVGPGSVALAGSF